MKFFLLLAITFPAFASNIILPAGYKTWKAPVANLAALPASGNTAGDCRVAKATTVIYCWTGAAWLASGGGGGGGISSINSDSTAAQTLAVGSSGTDFAIADNGTGTHTFNLPDASSTARGVITTASQTISGAKAFVVAPTLSELTASQAVVTNGSKKLASSVTTSTELALLSGKTALTSQYGRLTYAGIANCLWSIMAGAVWSNYGADTDCATPTTSGSLSAPATKIPGFVYSPPAGTYLIFLTTSSTSSNGTTLCGYRMYDGTNVIGVSLANSSTINVGLIFGSVTYSTNQSGLTVQLQAYTIAGAGTCDTYNDSADFHLLDFTVVRL